MRFSYSNPTDITLSSDQEELLATLDEVNSPLQGISRFSDLHCRDGVEVFIVDNDYIWNYLSRIFTIQYPEQERVCCWDYILEKWVGLMSGDSRPFSL